MRWISVLPCAVHVILLQWSEFCLCRLDRTKKTTETFAKVTTAVAGAVGTAVGSVAHGAVSTAKRSGLAKEGSSSRHAARVGKAGLVALVEVFDAMHDAGRKVVQQGATETATCVQYRCATLSPVLCTRADQSHALLLSSKTHFVFV